VSLAATNGLLNPTVDDIVRLAILVISAANVVVLLTAVRTLRQNARLLLDMEQFAREARQASRRRAERAEREGVETEN
jgi:hypothetical protein